MSYQMTVDEIAALDRETVIIPVASVEQHGHHLPVSTDVFIAQAFADRIGARLNAYVLPCLPISTCREHMGKQGSVWMNPDTYYQMMTDIVECLKEQGYKRVAIVVGHGGIFVMNPVVRTLNGRLNPDMIVCKMEPYQFIWPYVGQPANPDIPVSCILESTCQLHADEYETSIMLHLRPDLVHMAKAVDCIPNVPREYLNYGSILRYAPDGVWGEPTLATAEKGARLLDTITELSVQYIREAFAFMAGKEKLGYSNF